MAKTHNLQTSFATFWKQYCPITWGKFIKFGVNTLHKFLKFAERLKKEQLKHSQSIREMTQQKEKEVR